MNNKHILDYLDYYVDLPNPPQYAVMLTGPWGIGKSYEIKQYLQTLEKREKRAAYVSLYGVKSTEDISIAILTALVPKQDHKLFKLGSQLGRVLLKRLPLVHEAGLPDWIAENMCDLLVLDDLERAILSPVEVLGFINTFIEHEGRRVVIVANESEIDDKDNYTRVREKVIGMTFEFVEQSANALDHFIKCTEDEAARTFFKSAADTILEIFAQSETHNLRILDQSLRAWERVYQSITAEHRNKQKGITAAFKLFLALSLEVRAGRLGHGDLTDRVSLIVSGNMSKRNGKDDKGIPLFEAQERYGRICLHNGILSDDVLIQVLCDGQIDADAINESLSVHPLFVEPDEEPNWRKVWWWSHRDEQEFELAFAALEKEFAERMHDDVGVVLHIISLRLWGAKIGQLPHSENDIVVECKTYIDDLKKTDRLLRFRPDSYRDDAYGLMFHSNKSPAFQDLLTYYAKQSELVVCVIQIAGRGGSV